MKSSIFTKAAIWALLLSPILQIYGYGTFTMSELLVYTLIIVGIMTHKIVFKLPRYFHLYFCYFGIITIFSCLFGISELIPRLLGVVRLFFVFSLFFSNFEQNYFYKSYKKIVVVIVTIFFAQELSYRITGVRISGLIPFLPLVSNFAEIEGSFTFQEHLSLISRSASVFSEPAIMAQYLLPFFALSLFNEFGIKRLLYAGTSAFAILFSLSGNGIIGLGVILLVFCIYYFKMTLSKAIFLGTPLLVICFIYFSTSVTMQQYSERATELQSVDGLNNLTSGFYRIYRGYYVYDEYNIVERIFGINNFSLIRDKIYQCKYAFTFDRDDMYFNTIQNFLIKTGIIGLLLYLLFLKSIYKGNDYCSKSIVLTLFVFSFIANLFLSYLMLIYILIPFSTICKKKENKLCTTK